MHSHLRTRRQGVAARSEVLLPLLLLLPFGSIFGDLNHRLYCRTTTPQRPQGHRTEPPPRRSGMPRFRNVFQGGDFFGGGGGGGGTGLGAGLSGMGEGLQFSAGFGFPFFSMQFVSIVGVVMVVFDGLAHDECQLIQSQTFLPLHDLHVSPPLPTSLLARHSTAIPPDQYTSRDPTRNPTAATPPLAFLLLDRHPDVVGLPNILNICNFSTGRV